jgi:hypothetical protein
MFMNAKDLGVMKSFRTTLQSTTVRSFEGGLNVIDTDLNMKPKFAVVLDNLERGLDGALSLRPGTKLLARLPTSSTLANVYYFNAYLVAVTTDGRVFSVDGTGVVTELLVLGSPPWAGPVGSVISVSFTVFNSDLIISCGVHKPLIIFGNVVNPLYNQMQFLADLANLSNVNTPIGAYVIAHAQYTLIAGIPTQPSFLYISARGTSGTWLGDAAPNDAVAIDLGQRVSAGSSAITGLVSYRDKLLVTFERGVLPVNLGIYTGSPAVHTPTDDGFIEEFGCLSHRSLISVGDDTFYCDNIGVNSITRIILYNTLRPERASQFIDPLITALVRPLSAAQISQYVFAVYDMRNRRYILFVPVFDANGNVTETVAFSYTSVPALKITAWARLRGWKFSCGCRTALQNIVFGQGNKLYSYEFDAVDNNADYVGDTDVNADGTGVPVQFTWELPWADFGKRGHVKQMQQLSLDTTGTGGFTAKMYVDNIRTDSQGNDSPMLVTDMQGGSVGGYGLQKYGSTPYGGGRPSADERIFEWPAAFKIMKMQITGASMKPLKFISITFQYEMGDVRR